MVLTKGQYYYKGRACDATHLWRLQQLHNVINGNFFLSQNLSKSDRLSLNQLEIYEKSISTLKEAQLA